MTSDSAEVGGRDPAEDSQGGGSPDNDESRRAAASVARRRRLAEIFGTVLPESTSDDTLSDGVREGTSRDDWYLENRPPHH